MFLFVIDTVEPIQHCSSIFHWLMLVRSMIFLLMRSNICLLILPISDFVGLMRRHVGLLSKLGLCSLRVIKASLFAVILILSSRASLVAIVLASASVDMMLSGFAFLYDFVILLCSRSL